MNTSLLAGSSGLDSGDGDLFARIAGALEQQGYIILNQAFDSLMVESLFMHQKSLDDAAFSRAGIGRDDDFHLNRFVRTDEIHWLDQREEVTRPYFAWMEQLRLGINRRLFLGLFDYECHYARYEAGSYYKRHTDAFRGSNSRVVSTILYLNPAWQAGDGGELVLYAPDSDTVLETVQPLFGRLVIFLSEEFPHEVLTAQKARYSLTGWFRLNNTDSQTLDPAR